MKEGKRLPKTSVISQKTPEYLGFWIFYLVQSVQKVIEKQSFMIRVLSKMLSISRVQTFVSNTKQMKRMAAFKTVQVKYDLRQCDAFARNRIALFGYNPRYLVRRASPHAQKIAKGVYPTHFKVPAEKSIKQLIGTKSNNRVRETTAHTQIAFTMIINLFILHVHLPLH